MNIIGLILTLNHIKRIEGVETVDGVSITWGNPIRFKGAFADITSGEKLTFQQLNVEVMAKLYTNYMYIVEKDRVEFDSVIYEVKDVNDKHRISKLAVIMLGGYKE